MADWGMFFAGAPANEPSYKYANAQMNLMNEGLQYQQNSQRMQDDQALRKAMVVNPDGSVDRQATLRNLSGHANPMLAAQLQQQWSKSDLEQAQMKKNMAIADMQMTNEQRAKATQESQDIAKVAPIIRQHPNPPAAWDMSVTQMGYPDLKGKYTPDSLNMYEAQANNWIEMQKAREAQELEKIKAEKGAGIHPALGPDGKPGMFQITGTGEARQIPGLKPIPAASAIMMGANTTLTPEAKAMLVDKYRKTGVLDSDLSARMPGLRAEIINAAAAADKAEGKTTDLAGAKADYASNQSSLKDAQKRHDQLVTFEKTALANSDVFLEKAKNIIDSGSPALNAPLRKVASGAFGSEAQAAANTALQTIVPEFAKINSGSFSGVLSDHARQEASKLLPESATLGQYIAAINVLKQDAANRHHFMDQTISDIKGRISGKPNGSSPSMAIPVSDKASYDAVPSGSYYRAKDGSIGRKP